MDPYLGQITLVAFNFAPVGWAFCNGQLLPIDQYAALFQLIGTTYGGDGQTTFALPNLQSRIPLHQGQGTGTSNYVHGTNRRFRAGDAHQRSGPQPYTPGSVLHRGSNSRSPVNGLWAQASNDQPYKAGAAGAANMAPGAIGPAGGNQPHPNLMAYQALNYIIALEGIFPPQELNEETIRCQRVRSSAR